MMRFVIAVLFLGICSSGLAGCSQGRGSAPVLVDYGPTDIRAGKDFNVQTGGESAIWAHTLNANLNTVLMLNGTRLPCAYHEDTKLVTASVPKALYAKAGEYPLYLLDTKTMAKSNELKFIVNP